MRDRKANELSVQKTIAFLKDLHDLCDFNLSQNPRELQRLHKISNSTFDACLKLNIVKKDNIGWEWLKETENREMALQILNYLLEKSKKKITIPIDGLGEITTSLKQISERLASISTQNERALNGLKSPQTSQHETASIKANDLFTTTDKKEEQKFKIFLAVISGSYSSIGDDYEAQAKEAVIVTNHLFNQYFSQ